MEASEIIAALGGFGAVASSCGAAVNTVRYWERRGRIPMQHWDGVVQLAAAKGVPGIDADILRRLWLRGAEAA